MRHDFEERRAERVERFEDRAAKAKRESKAAFNTAGSIADMIPMGQPILIGHHSEGRARRDQAKIHNNMRKGIDLQNKAKHYEQRAISAASNTAIFSDDPNAAEKLAEKIERLEQRQQMMKDANKLVRKQNVEGLQEMGFSERSIAELFKPDFGGRLGFPDYAITNNGANIRRLKERLKQQVALESKETSEIQIGDVTIIENVEANRLQMMFDGKPADSVRQMLKRSGFRWAPSEGAWQRHISSGAMYAAKEIAKSIIA